MRSVHPGLRLRFLVVWREVLSESLMVPASARNQISESCGRPSAPTVANVATWVSSRSRCVAGIKDMVGLLFSARGVTEAIRPRQLVQFCFECARHDEVRRGQALVQLPGPAGPDDRGRHRRMGQDPCHRQRHERDALTLGDLSKFLDRGEFLFVPVATLVDTRCGAEGEPGALGWWCGGIVL